MMTFFIRLFSVIFLLYVELSEEIEGYHGVDIYYDCQ